MGIMVCEVEEKLLADILCSGLFCLLVSAHSTFFYVVPRSANLSAAMNEKKREKLGRQHKRKQETLRKEGGLCQRMEGFFLAVYVYPFSTTNITAMCVFELWRGPPTQRSDAGGEMGQSSTSPVDRCLVV